MKGENTVELYSSAHVVMGGVATTEPVCSDCEAEGTWQMKIEERRLGDWFGGCLLRGTHAYQCCVPPMLNTAVRVEFIHGPPGTLTGGKCETSEDFEPSFFFPCHPHVACINSQTARVQRERSQ